MIKATKSSQCICLKGKTWRAHPFDCDCGLIPQKYRGKFYLGTMEDWNKFIEKEDKRLESQVNRKKTRKKFK